MCSNQYSPIHEALRRLSEVCDGAVAEDDRGFNGPDSRICKHYASLESLNAGEAADARERLQKYVRQLGNYGIDPKTLPIIEAQAAAAEPIRARAYTYPGDNKDRKIDLSRDGQEFEISHPAAFAMEIKPKLAIFAGRRYATGPSRWLIPVRPQNAARLVEFGQANGYEITARAVEAFDAMMSGFQESPADSPQAQHPDRHVSDGLNRAGKAALILHWNFDRELYNTVSAIPTAVFDPGSKTWGVIESAKTAPAVLRLRDSYGFSIPANILARLEALAAAQGEARRESDMRKMVLLQGAQDIINASFGGKTPRDYQVAGVSFLLEAQRAILADDMGLGKTFEGMLWARAYQRAFSAHVFILCPKSLRGGWAKEAEACGVKVEIYSWAKLPKPVKAPYVLIGDEAHYTQNIKSQRTKGMLALAESDHCLGALMVSGTPMRGGRPVNLFPLLQAIRHPLGENRRAYEKHYCAAFQSRFGWDTTGAAHLDELMREIAPQWLRRTKDQVLKDLPAKQLIMSEVEISGESQALYDEAFEKAQAEYLRRRQDGEIEEGGEALVLLTHLRKAASVAKVEASIEMADEVLQQGRKVILFTEYKESAQRIADHYRKAGLGVELLTGDSKDRDAMIERFQYGNSRVWVATAKAGGVGLTLTAADTVILVDRGWMADDAEQAADRSHRMDDIMAARLKANPDARVTIYWVRAFEIDHKIDDRLQAQRGVLDQVLAGDRKTLSGVKSLNQVAREIAHELFGQDNKRAAA